VRSIIQTVAIGVLFLSAGLAADGLSGDWQLTAKARVPTEGVIFHAIHIEATPDLIRLRLTGVKSNGDPVNWTINTDYSGNPNAVSNCPYIEYVRCWRPEARSLLLKLYQGAQAVGYWEAAVAKNGKSLKVTTTSFDASGKETATVDTYERQ
jgi:hypothetical protein